MLGLSFPMLVSARAPDDFLTFSSGPAMLAGMAASPSSADVTDWIGRARAGNPEAVDHLCRLVQPSLEAYVERRMGAALRRWEEPDDIVQAVLAEVLRQPARLPDGLEADELTGRLFQTAKQRIRDAARRHRRSMGESLLEGSDAFHEPDRGSSGAVTRADTRRWLEELVARLPAAYADPVRLIALDGLTFAEAGRALDLDPETVRKRYERARDRLRARMEGRGDG